MPWPLSLLSGAVSGLATLVVKLVGSLLFAGVRGLLGSLVLPFLQATLFHPFTLTGSGLVATVLGVVWRFMVTASGGVALAALLWGVFRRMTGAATGQRVTWADIGEALGLYALVLVGGYAFLGLLLNVANATTVALMDATRGYLAQLANPTALAAGGTLEAAVVAYLVWP